MDCLYGRHSVLMALQGNQRRIKKLLLKESLKCDRLNQNLEKIAFQRGVPVVFCSSSELDKLSNFNNHNGMCLLTSKVFPTKLDSLTFVSDNGNFELTTSNGLKSQKAKHSNPLFLLLDRINDPQNLGTIIRTCSFLGADGLILTDQKTCPLSPAVSKASAGSMEMYLPYIYSIKSLNAFLKNARKNGWVLFSTPLHQDDQEFLISKESTGFPLLTKPSILILGSEGYGIRSRFETDMNLKIEGYNEHDSYIDSLNISAAAAILLSRILS